MLWARIHLRHLRMWREAARAIAEAVKELGLRAKVYVVGGAAENRLTILSDVDVMVCLDEEKTWRELRAIKHAILGKAFDEHGLPIDYPIDLHVYGPQDCSRILSRYKHLRLL